MKKIDQFSAYRYVNAIQAHDLVVFILDKKHANASQLIEVCVSASPYINEPWVNQDSCKLWFLNVTWTLIEWPGSLHEAL